MDDVALKIFRLEAHVALSDGLFLRLINVVAPLVLKHLPAVEARRELLRATIRGLEEDAKFGDQIYLSDAALKTMPDEMRALYADEYRDVAEKLKAYFESYMKGIKD